MRFARGHDAGAFLALVADVYPNHNERLAECRDQSLELLRRSERLLQQTRMVLCQTRERLRGRTAGR